MARLNRKIIASTLPETLIAMLIISIAFAISISVYISVVSSADYYQKQYIHQLLNKIAMEVKNGNPQEIKEFDGLVIRSNLQPYQNNERLNVLHVVALDQEDHKIAEQKEIIYLDQWQEE